MVISLSATLDTASQMIWRMIISISDLHMIRLSSVPIENLGLRVSTIKELSIKMKVSRT